MELIDRNSLKWKVKEENDHGHSQQTEGKNLSNLKYH